MISNDRFYDVLRSLPPSLRESMRRIKNPKTIRGGERGLMFSEIPQNPLRIVQLAAEIARDRFVWDGVTWGIDDEGCWVKSRWDENGPNYFEIIERNQPRNEAEVHAALRLLSSVSNERNT